MLKNLFYLIIYKTMLLRNIRITGGYQDSIERSVKRKIINEFWKQEKTAKNVTLIELKDIGKTNEDKVIFEGTFSFNF